MNERVKPGPKGPNAVVRRFPDSLRQRAWNAMVIKRKFSLSDIVRCACKGGERQARNNIGRYITALTRVGVLAEMKRRLPPTSETSNGEKRWLLVQELGRIAPALQRNGQIFDPNSGTVIEKTEDSNEHA